MERMTDSNITYLPIQTNDDYLLYKIQKLEDTVESKDKEIEILELKLQLKEVPPLLDVEGLGKYLGVTDNAARNLMKRKGFPKVEVGGSKAITERVIEWMAENIDE